MASYLLTYLFVGQFIHLFVYLFPTDPHLSSPVSSSFPLWMIILIIVATAVGLCLMLFVGVHLFYFIASKSQAGGMTEVQRHSEEVELFRSENV